MKNKSFQSANYPKQESRKLSVLALCSMVISFIFLIPVLSGLAGIILGIIALRSIDTHKDTLRGRGFAITGIVVGFVQILIIIVFLFVIMPLMHRNAKIRQLDPNFVSAPKKDYNHSIKITEFNSYNDKGISLQGLGKPKEALKEFQNALEISKKANSIAYYGIASCYMKLKEYDKAITGFDKAIAYNPKLFDAYQNKAVTYRSMGRYQDSIDACKKTISLFPDFARAYCSLGWTYEYLGKYEDAVTAHLEAIRLAPKWRFPQSRLNNILSKIENEKYRSEIYQEIKRIVNGKENK